MYKIQTLNKISAAGLAQLDGAKYTVADDAAGAQGVLVRSASMHELELDPALLAIARAGAGTNNIPIDKCSEAGIVVFNTPGANANAVKELVIAGLLISSRKVPEALLWAQTLKGKGAEVGKLVEKGKGQFAGPEILGKRLGVIGLGAIGVMVANAAHSLGMEVYGYDPYLSVKAAWGLSRSVKHAASLDEIFTTCDYITVHVPLTPDTRGMIGEASLATMKDGVRILNFARGELVDDTAILAALDSGKAAAYVTDFPGDAVLGHSGVIAIPHLGASTPESEENCAHMAVSQLADYLENGNIRNSVNLPEAELPATDGTRICVIHKNVVAVVSHISTMLSSFNINIEGMLNKSKKDFAYTMLDVTGDVTDEVAAKIEAEANVIRVRVIR